MSWSLAKRVGTGAALKQSVCDDMDANAERYEGKTEATDCLAVKAAIASLIDETQLVDGCALSVEASGSRGSGWLSINVQCGQVPLHSEK